MPVKTQPCVRCGGTDTRLCLVRYRVIHRDGTSDYDPRHFLCAPCYRSIGDDIHVLDYTESAAPVEAAREAFIFALEVGAISSGLIFLFWWLGNRG